MNKNLPVTILMVLTVTAAAAQAPTKDALIARAKSFELDTPYVPPPGDPLTHHAAGFAKVMCSAVFMTGLAPDFAAENVGFFTAPYGEREKLGKPVVDRANNAVQVTLRNGVTRTAKYLGSQGCVTLPIGESAMNFKPVAVKSRLSDPSTQLWPMGDVLPHEPLPIEIDAEKLKAAVNAAFQPADGLTAAFVVTWKGRLIAERYAQGLAAQTPLEGWSMGKSITAALFGILVKDGVYDLDQPAPIPEWQTAGDPRAKIRISDILHMSSGLRIKAPQDPDYDPNGTYPDHVYLYTGGIDSFYYAATRQLQWPPNTVGRYHNSDPVLISYLIRLAVEKRGDEYLSFPQRALFDKLGIRTMVIETDPFGNFLGQGYEVGSGRDLAISFFRVASGTVSAFTQRAIPNSSARLRPPGCRQSADLWSFLLAQRRRAISSPARCLLHVGRRRADDVDDSLARSRRGASRALSRRICRRRWLQQGARAVDRGGAKSTNEAMHPPIEK